jgi:hypothetical protein
VLEPYHWGHEQWHIARSRRVWPRCWWRASWALPHDMTEEFIGVASVTGRGYGYCSDQKRRREKLRSVGRPQQNCLSQKSSRIIIANPAMRCSSGKRARLGSADARENAIGPQSDKGVDHSSSVTPSKDNNIYIFDTEPACSPSLARTRPPHVVQSIVMCGTSAETFGGI